MPQLHSSVTCSEREKEYSEKTSAVITLCTNCEATATS